MIIRSQDKKELHNLDKISNICVLPCYGDEHKFIIEVNKQKNIGTYSTEEKAIKVLDMICNFYAEHLEELKCDEPPFVRAFFTMPQDSEV